MTVESDDRTPTVTTDYSGPSCPPDRALSGGAFQVTAMELSPASDGDQASVYVNGTLACATATGHSAHVPPGASYRQGVVFNRPRDTAPCA